MRWDGSFMSPDREQASREFAELLDVQQRLAIWNDHMAKASKPVRLADVIKAQDGLNTTRGERAAAGLVAKLGKRKGK